MTKFECAEKIVDTLTPDQVRKLAAKQVAQLMRLSRYNPNVSDPRHLINAAFDGIRNMDKKQLDFKSAWLDYRADQHRI